MMPTSQLYYWRLPTAILSLVITVQPIFAQQTVGNVGLRIIVAQGEDAANIIQQIPPQPLAVVVVDRANRPVSGAKVTFAAPETGASGDFADGSHSLTTFTDEEGRAVAPQYRANEVVGSYRVEVTADREGERVTASIRQRNIGPRKSLSKVFVGLAIAGAAAAALAAGSGGGNNSNPSTVSPPTSSTAPTISFGGSTVTGPPN
jgi:hypothetical protein